MISLSLNGPWLLNIVDQLEEPVFKHVPAQVPGSVYTDLLRENKIDDPFYRDNELEALKLMENKFVYERTFKVGEDLLACDTVLLCCEGLDTIAVLYINDQLLSTGENMHRRYEFSVDELIQEGENTIRIEFASPTRYIREAWRENPINGSTDAMLGFPHLRKAHCMFGWDWGPRLPDAGIWRDISLIGISKARIGQVYVWQDHEEEAVIVDLEIEMECWTDLTDQADLRIETTMLAPDGTVIAVHSEGEPFEVSQPQLWWPNGYGDQPLYIVKVDLYDGAELIDQWQNRIGLRTMTVRREKDGWGESFAHEVNGLCIFAMGADYIPEDNLLGRLSAGRTRRLLEDAVAANFNCIRVWGGGYYPEDWFYDACDELGLVVWQDFMFACANYDLTPAFKENIRQEFIDNIIRLRHHASLGLWCGNNEMEWFQANENYQPTPRQKADYIRMFEYLIPEVLDAYDPQTFYWPASPSSGGSFDDPNDPNRGDVHYWEVWHGNQPFSAYRDFYFRYASEFGFQSFPGMKTIAAFTRLEDRNIFSRVMEMHQRNQAANGKILNYLSATYLFPRDFEQLLYASQLLQAEAIQYGVEHWRRNRGRCMGAVYWQLNDCWPVASWSSIDSFGRWKALHYYARRFFAPVMLSCAEEGEMTQRRFVIEQPHAIELAAALSVANETTKPVHGLIRWSLRDESSHILRSGESPVSVDPLSSRWLDRMVFADAEETKHHLSFSLEVDGVVISRGSVLFCAPKHYPFADPQLSWQQIGDTVTVKAENYARCVEIESETDLLLSDNYFHLEGGEEISVEILRGQPVNLRLRSVYDIAAPVRMEENT